MKNAIILSLLTAGISCADFETWTNKDGKPAELELTNVTDNGGEKAGEFRMRNGTLVTLKASDLSDESAAKLNAWLFFADSATAPTVVSPSDHEIAT